MPKARLARRASDLEGPLGVARARLDRYPMGVYPYGMDDATQQKVLGRLRRA